jgi:hypothetical protein
MLFLKPGLRILIAAGCRVKQREKNKAKKSTAGRIL